MTSVLLFKISMTMLVSLIFSHGLGTAIWGKHWKRPQTKFCAFFRLLASLGMGCFWLTFFATIIFAIWGF